MMKRMMPYMAAQYGLIALYQCYASLFFTGKGLGPGELAWTQAALPAASLLAQPFWGMLADRTRRLWVLRALALGAAVALCLFPLGKSVMGFTALAAGFAFFQTSMQPVSDAAVLGALRGEGKPLGPLRAASSIAFAIAAAVSGWAASRSADWLPWAGAALALAALAASFLLPDPHLSKAGKLRLGALL